MGREKTEIVEAKLDPTSRGLLAAFIEQPARQFANLQMERWPDGTWTLFVTIPSPTGDRRRHVSLWLDEKRIPSLEFGGWHTHADLWDHLPEDGLAKMLDYLGRIISGKVVLTEVPTVGDGFPFRVLDLADSERVLDMVTRPGMPSAMKLLSWSGREDTTLDNLRAETA